MVVVKAPNNWVGKPKPWVFLAGSIEMGEAEDWQSRVERELVRSTLLNPRRDDWDSSWEQSIDNPEFREQVEWELIGLEEASAVLVYFSPGTKSPITLLELGLILRMGKVLVVCCPDGYWRKGNVDITCRRYGLKVYGSLEEGIERLKVLEEWFYG